MEAAVREGGKGSLHLTQEDHGGMTEATEGPTHYRGTVVAEGRKRRGRAGKEGEASHLVSPTPLIIILFLLTLLLSHTRQAAAEGGKAEVEGAGDRRLSFSISPSLSLSPLPLPLPLPLPAST